MRAILILLYSLTLLRAAEMPALDGAGDDWNAGNALVLAEASALAYHHEAEAKIKEVLRCERVEFFTAALDLLKRFDFEEGEPGPQAFLAAGKEHVVLAFRGTEINLVDLLTDAWAQPGKLAAQVPGQVHSGFAATFHVLWPKLQPRLAEARAAYPQAKLWITGHSLGGGLAVMAAAHLRLVEQWPVHALLTCGAPVTGDVAFHKALAAALPARHWRVVCPLDPVTLDLSAVEDLPLVSLPAELTVFRHGGKAVWLHPDGTLAAGGARATAAAAAEFAKDWIKSRGWKPPADAIERHSMGSAYLPALRKLHGGK